MSKPGIFINKSTGEEIDVIFSSDNIGVSQENKTVTLTRLLTTILQDIALLQQQIGSTPSGGGTSHSDAGISDVHVTNDNNLIIETTDGNEYVCPINVPALLSTQITSTSEVTSIGSGSLADAIAYANDGHLNTHFQWLLIDEDDDGNDVTKIIWHIGSARFIDACGGPIQQTT